MKITAKTSFEIVATPSPITTPLTKFGGQPVWIGPPRWPNGPEWGGPMRFLCQIALRETLFPGAGGWMAYLFFEDASEPLYAGAFAAVIQAPGRTVLSTVPETMCGAAATGPTIVVYDDDRQAIPAEFAVVLGPETDEPVVPLDERYQGELDYKAGFTFPHPELAGNKIGGQPIHIETTRPEACFLSDDWRLLLQLAPTQGYWAPRLRRNFYPFAMELGEFGILSVFLEADFTDCRICVQQP